MSRPRIGTDAEDQAADYLIRLGYTLVTRRYKARHGEIDLVALDGDTLLFVEVKARSGATPEDAVGRTKIERLTRAAAQYLAETGQHERAIRFDIIAIDPTGLRHHQDVLG